MNTYNSMEDFLNSISSLPITAEIQNAIIKSWGKIHGYNGKEFYKKQENLI